MSYSVIFTGSIEPEKRIRTLDDIRSYYRGGEYISEVSLLLEGLKEKLLLYPPAEQAIILMDVDETALNSFEFISGTDFDFYPHLWEEWMLEGRIPANEPVLQFYKEMTGKGYRFIFLTGRMHVFRDATERNLLAAGYGSYVRLITRETEDDGLEPAVFKTRIRKSLSDEGFRILANIGDQESDIEGGLAEHPLRLPNFLYQI